MHVLYLVYMMLHVCRPICHVTDRHNKCCVWCSCTCPLWCFW